MHSDYSTHSTASSGEAALETDITRTLNIPKKLPSKNGGVCTRARSERPFCQSRQSNSFGIVTMTPSAHEWQRDTASWPRRSLRRRQARGRRALPLDVRPELRRRRLPEFAFRPRADSFEQTVAHETSRRALGNSKAKGDFFRAEERRLPRCHLPTSLEVAKAPGGTDRETTDVQPMTWPPPIDPGACTGGRFSPGQAEKATFKQK